MKAPNYRVLKEPLITEKGTVAKDKYNQYIFRVAKSANKIEIKHAVERIFNVSVIGVKTMVYRGKIKRVGRFIGKQANWKKAVVTVKDGQAINFFDGV